MTERDPPLAGQQLLHQAALLVGEKLQFLICQIPIALEVRQGFDDPALLLDRRQEEIDRIEFVPLQQSPFALLVALTGPRLKKEANVMRPQQMHHEIGGNRAT